MCVGASERERVGWGEIILYYTRMKIKTQGGLFCFVFLTNLSPMEKTATFKTSNKKNCGKIKYDLKTKQKTITV